MRACARATFTSRSRSCRPCRDRRGGGRASELAGRPSQGSSRRPSGTTAGALGTEACKAPRWAYFHAEVTLYAHKTSPHSFGQISLFCKSLTCRCKVHKSERFDGYGGSFGPGDVVGCAISLPPEDDHLARPPPPPPWAAGGLTLNPGQLLGDAAAAAAAAAGSGGLGALPGHTGTTGASFVRFFLNGVDQGVAYRGVPNRSYYPAVSLYGPARIRANFGPNWLVPPKDAEAKQAKWRPMSDLKPLKRDEASAQAKEVSLRRAGLRINQAPPH
mmetsp:Transcript_42259/g.95591  ORF Transcript_42259/g.95591 Transcript_42259/m.95591 type:complete len:273 (-) Transcript_42259:241-1059(-)